MSAASNGVGSHFAPAPDNGPSSNDAYRSSGDSSAGRHSSAASSHTYQGFSFEEPNGSHAAVDPTKPIPGSRKISPSETDTFLAAAVRSAQESQNARPREGARFTNAHAASPTSAPIPPVGPAAGRSTPEPKAGETATIPAVWNAADSGAAAASAASAAPASAPASAGRPVNPLVAARAAAGAQASTSTAAPAAATQAPSASGNLFPIQEVEEPKRGGTFDTTFAEGSHKRTALFVVLAIVVVALIFVGAFFGLRAKEAADARTKIDDAIGRLRDSDGVIVPLDAAIAAEISSGIASDSLSNLMLQSASTSTALSDAEQFANDAARSSDLLSAEENDAIAAVKSSVAARRSMLEIGRMLLSTDTAVNDALNSLAMAYGAIADSNAKIQSSADQFAAYNAALENNEDTSGYDLWAIVQLDNDALADLTVAQEWVTSARDAFDGADLTVLDNYLNARINQVNMLIQVDTCVANGDLEGAANLSGPYAEADANAQNAAAQVPATAAELLVGAYANATTTQRDAYDAARSKCVEADAVLNAYLGITDARKEMGVTGDSKVPAAAPAQISDPVAPVEPAPAEPQPAEGEGTVEPAPEATPEVAPEETPEAA